jgi:nucleoid-associated protein YgaU
MALEKATIVNTDTNVALPVQFNPEEYSLNADNNFAQAAIPGRSAPLLQFTHGNLRTLDMELIFDSYEQRLDVRPRVQQLLSLLDINPDTHAPPVLLFVWGSLRFSCVLVKASQKYILFLANGSPARARIQVTFNEFTNSSLEAKEIKRETSSFTKVYVIRRGDTLSGIAEQVYSDATLWRPLAIRNRLDDPHQLVPGRRLSVPPLPFRDPDSGKVYPD